MAILTESIAIFKYFEEISKIPRGSFHEEKISNYLVEFAKKNKLKYFQDDMKNVIIYKDGTKGYENHPPVMLQGHIDMVCEKDYDYDHDFDNDPLKLYVEDGYLHAKGTTLGADDGYAISYMLAILESKDIDHPPLDCVFTVQEEVGMLGVRNISADKIRAKRMISMDTGNEAVTCVSSSGGRRVTVTKELNQINNNWNTYRLKIEGLLGGHSGKFINKERGNANKIAFRMLQHLSKKTKIRLVNITGGLKANAIARECVVEFAVDTSLSVVQQIFENIMTKIQTELEFSDPDLTYSLNQLPKKAPVCFDEKTSQEAIDLIYLLPDGFKAKSMVIDDLTTVSLNLGQMEVVDNKIKCHYLIRSPLTSAREELTNEIELLTSLLNASVQIESDYPGWNYETNSFMRDILKEVIKEQLGTEMITQASHGGLEIGILKGLIPELDIITIGPECSGAHTPEEKMNLASFLKMYEVLKAILKKL